MAGSETSFNSYTFTYKWKINDLVARIHNPSVLSSPQFSSPSGAAYKPTTKWTLRIFSEGCRRQTSPTSIDEQSLSVELKRLASSPATTAGPRVNIGGPPRQQFGGLIPGQYPTSAPVQQRDDSNLDQAIWVEARLMPFISIDDTINKCTSISQGPVKLSKPFLGCDANAICFQRFLTTSKVRGSNSVMLECEIKVWLLDKPIHVNKEPLSLSSKSNFNLSKCMEEARQNNLFTDVTLVADGKEFKAHKVVLASQSQFFKTRFASRWSGSAGDRVEMTDVPASVMEEILSYMYTGTVSNIETTAYQLLPVAEEYGLVGLRKMCEEDLIKSLTSKTAISTLIHAAAHNAPDLKKACMEFISSNMSSVKQNEWWGKLKEKQTYHELWVELLEYIVTEKHSTVNAPTPTYML